MTMVGGLFQRLFAALIVPDPAIVKDFRSFCTKDFEHLAQFIQDSKCIDDIPFLSFYEFASKWKDSKCDNYIKGLVSASLNPDLLLRFAFKAMVKAGEVWTTTNVEVDRDGFIKNVSERGRIIQIPNDYLLCYLAYIQRFLMPILKSYDDSFCHGKNPSQMA